MRKKADFVTNSSSTSYIVHIPVDFTLDAHTEDIKQSILDWDGEVNEKRIEKVKDQLHELMNLSGRMYEYDNRIEMVALRDLFHKLDFIIDGIDVGSDMGVLVNINTLKARQKIEKIGA